LIDATAGAVDAIVFVALAGIAPIGEEDAPVGGGEEIGATEPGVADVEEIGEMRGEIAAALGEELFAIEAPAVEVDGEELVMEFGGPGTALVDEATFVRVTAPEGVGAIFFAAGFLAAAFLATGFFAATFLATGFFAAGFFLAAGFFAATFFAAGFLAAAFFAGALVFVADFFAVAI